MSQCLTSVNTATAHDAHEVLKAVLTNLEDLRAAEIQVGPTSICYQHLPEANANSETIITWLNNIFLQMRAGAISLNKLRSNSYSRKSEKVYKEASKAEKKANRIVKKGDVSRAEVEKTLEDVNEKIRTVEGKISQNLDDELENLNVTGRLADTLKRLKQLRSKLMKQLNMLGEEPLTEPNVSEDYHEDNPQHNSQSHRPSHTSQEDASSAENSNEWETDVYSIICGARESKRQKNEKKYQDVDEKKPIEHPDIWIISPQLDAWTNKDKGDHLYDLESLKKKFDVIHATLPQVEQNVCESAVLKDNEGSRIPFNAATCYEVSGLDENRNVVASVNSDLLLMPKSDEDEKKKEELREEGFSDALMAIMTEYHGQLVISPTEFCGIPSILYGMRPCFMRSTYSESLAIRVVVDFIVMHLAKNRIADHMQLQYGDLALSKQQIIEIINGMGRALSPLAQEMRKILLAETETMHNDDSYIRCLEWQRDEQGELKHSLCHIWGMTTFARAEKKGAIYLATKSRSTEDFLRQFGLSKEGDKENIFPCGIRNFISDGCSSHPSGLDKVEELSGRKIVRAGCYAHLRRYFREALICLNLKDIFDAATSDDFRAFDDLVESELTTQGIKIGQNGRKVLTACHLIEMIFLLEQDFAIRTREEMEERRKKYTTKYVDELFAVIDELKNISPTITTVNKRNGETKYKGGSNYPWGRAVVYGLNNKIELHAFLQCGDIECSNNNAERILRPTKFHSRSMEFLGTESGFKAFSDLMTIVTTCRLNVVNPYEYLHWAFTNAKIRIESYRLTNCKTKQICWLPTPYKKENQLIGLYDPEFETPFDEIDWTGLDVWSYIQLRKEEAPRIRKK